VAALPTPEPDPDSDAEFADDLELLRRAQAGDARARNEFIVRYYEPVLRMVRSLLNAELRAEMESGDVLHEAMIRAIKALPRFEVRTRPELVSWFAKLVENFLRSAGRAVHTQKRDRDLEVSIDSLKAYIEESSPGVRPADRGPSPFDLTSQQEVNQIYLDCLAELAPEHREVLQLRLGQHLAWGEISECLGRTPDAARMLFARALIQIQKILRRRGLDSSS
jgi:RNA polymerase sigma-70 factor (ECF subfamily)